MQPFNILDPDLNIFQNRLLEASAGTGKTFAIEHLVVRLLLESDPPYALQDILAVTFTREAAHEMKCRIRSQLDKKLKEGNPRVRKAIVDFDQIQVFTIHGFCHKMLTEFAFEANASLRLPAPDKPHHLQEMRQTVEDFLRTAEPRFSQDIALVLKQTRLDLDKCCSRIIEKMQTQERAEEVEVPFLLAFSFSDLKEDLLQLAPRYKRLKEEEIESQLASFTQCLEENNWPKLLSEREWFFEKMHEGNVKVKAKPFAAFTLKAPAFFHWLETKLLPPLKKGKDPHEALKRIATECSKRWKIKAERYDHTTFDDLLLKMHQALQTPAFLQKVQAKYKAVIVDEFQDTDSTQWALFETLFLSTHLLYLVADPKQSIYGFRNADIYTYMRAAEALGNKAQLDTNYRSSPALIDALNALFTRYSEWIQLPSLPNALRYYPVKAGRTEGKLGEEPITYFGIAATKGREKSWPTKTMEEEQIFPYIASEICRLQPLAFSQVAILIKDRYQAQRLQTHLNLWNIPSQIKRSFHLAESPGFKTMKMLLEALAYPEDEAKGRAVCLSGLNCKENTPFSSLKTLFEDKGLACVFTELMTNYANADSALYAELRKTLEILIDHSPSNLKELLLFMEQLKNSDPEIDERLKLEAQEGEDAVAIMTTFGSKGLEFDVVFALGTASETPETEPEKVAEMMRQLYVAFTRSREKLYIPILKDTKGEFHHSPTAHFFQKWDDLPVQWIEPLPIRPLQKLKSAALPVPPLPTHLSFEKEVITSFSALAHKQSSLVLKERFEKQNLKQKSPHTLPLGAETGTLIHTVFERIFQNKSATLEPILFEVLAGTHLEGWEEVVYDMVSHVLAMPLIDSFSLSELKEGQYFQEMEFLFPQNNQLIKGFIDLVFQKGNQFYVVDWKTNWLGPSEADYNEANLAKAMQEHDYVLQASLYQEALQRYVKRLYICPEFGGSYYIFVRGKKAVHLGIS